MSRYARRTDTTHRPAVKILRAAGWSVQTLHRVGRGMPDLLIGKCGKTGLMEMKSPRAQRSDGTLGLRDRVVLEEQARWESGWFGSPVLTAADPVEALFIAERWLAAERGDIEPTRASVEAWVAAMVSPAVQSARRSPRRA